MLALLLALSGGLGAESLPASLEPQGMALSAPVAQGLERLRVQMMRTLSGRKLLADSEGVRVQQWRGSGAAIRYLPGRAAGVLSIDAVRLRRLTPAEALLALVREKTRAVLRVPFDMPEVEMSAYAQEMRFALDYAEADKAFDAELRKAYRAMDKRVRAERDFPPFGDDESLTLAPRDEVERLAYFMRLFAEDPEYFYWAAERGLPRGSAAVGLSSLEDFMDRYGADLISIGVGARARYASVRGRYYPAALVRAAQAALASGGLKRIHEALALFDEPAVDLKKRILNWAGGPL